MNVGQSWRWELEARGRELIVTLPGTSYRVIYRQHQNSPKPVTAIVPKGNERGALVSREEFFARALRLANGKARELGWFEYLKARTSQAHEGGSLPAEVSGPWRSWLGQQSCCGRNPQQILSDP